MSVILYLTRTAVGLSSLLVRRHWIRYLTNSETRPDAWFRVLNSSSRQSCSVSTNVTGASEVSLNDMHYINSRFTYLTYLLTRTMIFSDTGLRRTTMSTTPTATDRSSVDRNLHSRLPTHRIPPQSSTYHDCPSMPSSVEGSPTTSETCAPMRWLTITARSRQQLLNSTTKNTIFNTQLTNILLSHDDPLMIRN